VDGKRPEEVEKNGRKLKEHLRTLLREIAQPVVVVTSFMPSTNSFAKAANNHESLDITKFHGATLSSFTSIAMDPFPLVAFALRIPSRMATTLSALSSFQPASSRLADLPAHMVINLLSASQAPEAVKFSRPDLHPTPFATTTGAGATKFSLTKEGLPVLHDVVGALSCRLVSGPIPLYDLDHLEEGLRAKAREPVLVEGDVASELFIARVVRVENIETRTPGKLEGSERTLPLIYHRRGYTSCKP
jgi:flavin reductase (DIM6/NTAB) family NADH-FMN oxidoreductase RutF